MTDTQPLPAALLDQLIDAGNKALNDYYHERACACSTWPEKCASWKSPGDMFFGYWDTDAFAVALPAIVAAYEQTKVQQMEEQPSNRYAFNARSVNRSTKHILAGGGRTLCDLQATPPMDAEIADSLPLCGSCRRAAEES